LHTIAFSPAFLSLSNDSGAPLFEIDDCIAAKLPINNERSGEDGNVVEEGGGEGVFSGEDDW